jgi:hypothetical protein
MGAETSAVLVDVPSKKAATKPILDMHTFTFERVKSDHAELTELWKQLDSKAQATTGIAGFILAGAYAGIKGTAIGLSMYEKGLILLVIVMLIASVATALKAMRISDIPAPPPPGKLLQMLYEILDAGGDMERRQANLVADTVQLWVKENDRFHELVRAKAQAVGNAQLYLGAAIGLFAIQVFVIVWSH